MVKKLKKQFGIRLTDEQVVMLKTIAEKEQRSVGAVIRIAIEKYLMGVKK